MMAWDYCFGVVMVCPLPLLLAKSGSCLKKKAKAPPNQKLNTHIECQGHREEKQHGGTGYLASPVSLAGLLGLWKPKSVWGGGRGRGWWCRACLEVGTWGTHMHLESACISRSGGTWCKTTSFLYVSVPSLGVGCVCLHKASDYHRCSVSRTSQTTFLSKCHLYKIKLLIIKAP